MSEAVAGGGKGGLEQARQVFLQGTGLPEAWAGQARWRVLEAGFGLGLNFLASWHAWRSDAQRPGMLHFASIDASPLSMDDLLRSVGSYPALQPLAEELAVQWQGLVPGFHRMVFEGGRVLLTLCVGDVHALLREQEFHANAVFLEGFDPVRHPDLGSLPTLKAVTRLCRRGTRLAAATVTDALQHDLQSCGWQVERRTGLPPRGESLAARYDPAWEVKGLAAMEPALPRHAIVIGAGLAGAAIAASLARRGCTVRVLDAAPAPAAGASGLPVGLLAPHQSPDDNLLSRLSRVGVRMTLQQAQQRLGRGLEWERTGALEWRGDDRRGLPVLGEALAPWSRVATPAQKRAAGIAETEVAWWHENAAWIEPAALVRSWLREPGVRFEGERAVARVVRTGAAWAVHDAAGASLGESALVVVAAALGSAALLPEPLQLHAVRGQVTWAPHEGDAGALPPFPVNGHGHFLPRVPLVERGAWITGSSYVRGSTDTTLRAEEDAENRQRVAQVLPRSAAVMEAAAARGQVRSWSGVRCTSSDRRPLVGEAAPALWLSTAMGSRGLTFAALAGELIAARLWGEPLPLETRLAHALDLSRRAPPRSG